MLFTVWWSLPEQSCAPICRSKPGTHGQVKEPIESRHRVLGPQRSGLWHSLTSKKIGGNERGCSERCALKHSEIRTKLNYGSNDWWLIVHVQNKSRFRTFQPRVTSNTFFYICFETSKFIRTNITGMKNKKNVHLSSVESYATVVQQMFGKQAYFVISQLPYFHACAVFAMSNTESIYSLSQVEFLGLYWNPTGQRQEWPPGWLTQVAPSGQISLKKERGGGGGVAKMTFPGVLSIHAHSLPRSTYLIKHSLRSSHVFLSLL